MLAGLYTLDRALKWAAVVHFFRQPAAPAPQQWPSVTLLQPITRGASGLPFNLQARAKLQYPAPIQHVLICDEQDRASPAICATFKAEQPQLQLDIVLVESEGGVASKIAKLQAGLARARGEVLCFMDDDVAPRPDALEAFVRTLDQPRVGAVFGLACYTNWRTPWSSLMSAFVNSNALLSYVPLVYMTEPFTITGHFYALRRAMFEAVGGLEGMEERLDDDHELARRLRRAGLRVMQTAVVYDVDNDLPTIGSYLQQMKRWFVFSRQWMAPELGVYDQLVTFVGSVGNLAPGLLLLLALGSRRRAAGWAFVTSVGLWAAGYAAGERGFLRRYTSLRRWPLALLSAVVSPWLALAALFGDNEIGWRGQRLRILREGRYEVVD